MSVRRGSARATLLWLVLLGAMAGCTEADTEPGEPTALGSIDAAVPAGLAERCPPPGTKLRLPDGPLPSGVVGVRLCPAPVKRSADGRVADRPLQPPADELVTGGDALVALLNALDVSDPGSGYVDDGGPTLVYWFRYADGDARAVSYDAYGGHTVVTGEREERVGGADLAKAFSDALAEQRGTTPPAVAHPTPDCNVYTRRYSVLPMTDVALASATLCVDAGRLRFRAARIPARLVERLNAELLPDPTASPTEKGPCTSDYWRIEGYTTWGDRVFYTVHACRAVGTWPGPGRDVPEVSAPLDPALGRALGRLPLGPVQTVPSRR